jgi:translation elongation factor EF-1beta
MSTTFLPPSPHYYHWYQLNLTNNTNNNNLQIIQTKLYSVITILDNKITSHPITIRLVKLSRLPLVEVVSITEKLIRNGCDKIPLLHNVMPEELESYGIYERSHVKAITDAGFSETLRIQLLDFGIPLEVADDYASVLVVEGCNTMLLLKTLTPEMLQEIGITNELHISQIMNGIENLLVLPTSEGFDRNISSSSSSQLLPPPGNLTRTVSLPFADGELSSLLHPSISGLSKQDVPFCCDLLIKEGCNTLKLFQVLDYSLLTDIGFTNEQHIQGILKSVAQSKSTSTTTTTFSNNNNNITTTTTTDADDALSLPPNLTRAISVPFVEGELLALLQPSGLPLPECIRYCDLLLNEGCNTYKLFTTLTESLLMDIGITNEEHIQAILKCIDIAKNTRTVATTSLRNTLARSESARFGEGELRGLLSNKISGLSEQDIDTCCTLLTREGCNTLKLFQKLTPILLSDIGITNKVHVEGIMKSVNAVLSNSNNNITSNPIPNDPKGTTTNNNDTTPVIAVSSLKSPTTNNITTKPKPKPKQQRRELLVLDIIGSNPSVDLNQLANDLKTLQHPGIETWGESKTVNQAFGDKKLVISVILKSWMCCEDDMCDIITDKFESRIQSIDVAARSALEVQSA